jgi:hypothetical protein
MYDQASHNISKKFTFQIDLNGDVKFLGKGDLHDAEFDTLKVDSNFETMHQFCHYGFMNLYEKFSVGRHRDLQQQQTAIPIIPLGPTETGFELEGNHTIHYRIHVYPSQAFKEKYVNHEPKLLAIAVASIFVITSFVFIVYDRMMEKRQNNTMEAAVLANKVVNSQFPAIVRDRLFENIKRNKENRYQTKVTVNQEKSKRGLDIPSETGDTITMIKRAQPHRSRISIFLSKHSTFHQVEQIDNSNNCDEDDSMLPPIADLFPHTSVLFADIVGFTAWSSEREPTQVFQLLVSRVFVFLLVKVYNYSCYLTFMFQRKHCIVNSTSLHSNTEFLKLKQSETVMWLLQVFQKQLKIMLSSCAGLLGK